MEMKLVTLKVTEDAAHMLKIIAAIMNKKHYEAFEIVIKEKYETINLKDIKSDDG